jgi:outer membrane protein OmpA-like peptidoglycan-associated protein
VLLLVEATEVNAPLLLALGATSWAQDVATQNYPIDAEKFRPTIDPYGYAVTESAATLEHLQVGVGLWGWYSEDSAVLTVAGERLIGPSPSFPDAMLDQKSVVDFQLGLGIGKVFSLVAEGPVVLWQTGFEPAAPRSPEAVADPEPSAIGDLRVTPKFVLIDLADGSPIGLSFLTTGTIPTGSQRSLIGEGDFTATPMLAFEAANGAIRTGEYLARGAMNVGVRIKPPDTFRDVTFGSEFVFRGAMSARPIHELEIGTDLQGSVAGFRTAQVPLEILPWMRLHGAGIASFTAGAGFGLNPGLGSPDWRVFGGATIAPKFDPLSLDRDKDGIPNRYDQCINQPEDIDNWQDEDGCPDPDNDGDGILDTVDSCRDKPEDFDGFEDVDGCPDLDNDGDGIMDAQDQCRDIKEDPDGFQDLDGCPDDDNDGDGIPDLRDACPNAAENFNGVQDEDGCPEDWSDADGDGIHDANDNCPNSPEDLDNFEDEDGCPDFDNDGDGIVDTVDQCPFDPETKNNYLDEDGCPDTAPERVVVGKEKITITEKIFFQYNRAVIQKVSFELLDEIARVINDTPRVKRIQVEGHTDADGSDTYNLKLSQSRAEAVVEYLVKAGVDGSRLVAKGFGEGLPIDTNDTTKGKARNRRVEFTILEQD